MTDTRWTAAGEVVRELRRAKGLTQAELAERVGRDRAYLSRIETGDVAPGRDTLNLLIRELGPIDSMLWSSSASESETVEMEARR